MLKNKIQQDIIASMKNQDKDKLEILRYLVSQIKNAEIEKGKQELTDEETIKLVSSQIKKLNESLILFANGHREDLVAKTKKEIAILSVYLPQQMTDKELNQAIDKIISQNPAVSHPGALIGLCVKALVGKADASRIARIVQQKFKR